MLVDNEQIFFDHLDVTGASPMDSDVIDVGPQGHGAAGLWIQAYVSELFTRSAGTPNAQVSVWHSDDNVTFLQFVAGKQLFSYSGPVLNTIALGQEFLHVDISHYQHRYIRLRLVTAGVWTGGTIFAHLTTTSQLHAGIEEYKTRNI